MERRMTARNSIKRRIRARMSKTGESYSTARRAILRASSQEDVSTAMSMNIVLAQPPRRTGDLEQDIETMFVGDTNPLCDLLVLPELIGANSEPDQYTRTIRSLARRFGCYVVGGSSYRPGSDGVVNAGIVVDSQGQTVTRYEKLRPYGSEIDAGISSGTKIGQFDLRGRSFAVMICSDLWFSETIASLGCHPDVLLIPSFSITQRGDPEKARQLWKHMLVARAYEYSAYVGVCDWAHPCEFEGLRASGVSGFADPRPNGESFFEGNGNRRVVSYELDFDRLDSFRENRVSRGFSTRLE